MTVSDASSKRRIGRTSQSGAPTLLEGRAFLSLVGFLFEDARLAAALAQPPCSAFVAEGSEVSVFRGSRMRGP